MKERLEKQINKVLPFDIAYQFDKVFEKRELGSNGYDQSRDARFIQAFESAACGSYEDAVLQFGDLAQTYPANAFVAYFHAGLCALLGGLVSDAAIALDRALKLKADDYWAHVYAGAVYHVIGLEGRANAHWFAANKIDPNEISQKLLS
jgi:tetratricopeptide (TPR) repeat protein